MLTAIKIIECELATRKEKAQSLIKKATELLGGVKPQQGKPILVRLKVRKGYQKFSITWCKVIYYNPKTKSIYTKNITLGRRYLITKAKFYRAIRGYPQYVQEQLWFCETLFAKIRKEICQLSSAWENLTRYMKASNGGAEPPGGGELPGVGESNPWSGSGKAQAI